MSNCNFLTLIDEYCFTGQVMSICYKYYRLQVISGSSNRDFCLSSTYRQALHTFIHTNIFCQVGQKNWHYDLLIVDVIWGAMFITDLFDHGHRSESYRWIFVYIFCLINVCLSFSDQENKINSLILKEFSDFSYLWKFEPDTPNIVEEIIFKNSNFTKNVWAY